MAPLRRLLALCCNACFSTFQLSKPKSISLVSIPNNKPNTSTREAFKKMKPPVSTPDLDSFIKLIEACIKSRSISDAKNIHQMLLTKKSIVSNPIVLEKLTQMYISCGETEQARLLFDKIPHPSMFLWNAMIRAYSWNGPLEKSLDLYKHMIASGVRPNKFTYPFVLKACSGLLALEEGQEIHDHAKTAGLELDLYVSTALIDMYMKCGRVNNSRDLFDKMPDRDAITWNAMVAGYSLHGMYDETVDFVIEMQRMGTSPNASTVVGLLPVVGQAKELRQGKSVHGFCMRRFFIGDVLVETALLDMYAKSEYLDYARKLFDSMADTNEVTWSALVGGYVQCGRIAEALAIFDQVVHQGSCYFGSSLLATVLQACARLHNLTKGKYLHGYLVKSGSTFDIMVANSLLSMYAKIGHIEDALTLFEEIERKDTVSYSAMISGCLQNGYANEALLIFKHMHVSGLDPDVATMVGIIPACSHLAALKLGRCSHGYVLVRGLAFDISVGNALIDMYSKCGRLDFSEEVFDRMSERDIVSWNTMIASFGLHGRGREAISLFSNLENAGLTPDDVTFICLISACSHSGLVTEGKNWFQTMTKMYNIEPRMEHYICMVDLLGRGGFLSEAYLLIQGMPFEADVRVWGALLGACRIHGNVELGEEVSRTIQMLGPEGTGNFVLLSNIYSAAGRFQDAAQIRIIQRDKGFKKSPGCSWVEVGGTLHAFVGGDQSHPHLLNIYQKLDDLLIEIKKLGYQPDTTFVLHDVEEEEKEHAVLYHSEKLAIAFGMLSLSSHHPIFIIKNLRVCGDCHTAIKFFTLATRQTITVRDASRFHHFVDGKCNCGDFW